MPVVFIKNKIALFFIIAATPSLKNRMLMNKYTRESNCVSCVSECVCVAEMGAGQTGSRWQMAER